MGQKLKKEYDWVTRLDSFFRDRGAVAFNYGENDCALFVCDAIKSMTGVDVGEAFRGGYKSSKDAKKIVSEWGGLEAIGDSIAEGYGMEDVQAAFAGRGDAVVFIFEGVESFGIVSTSGRDVCGLSHKGCAFIPKAKATIIRAWRIE